MAIYRRRRCCCYRRRRLGVECATTTANVKRVEKLVQKRARPRPHGYHDVLRWDLLPVHDDCRDLGAPARGWKVELDILHSTRAAGRAILLGLAPEGLREQLGMDLRGKGGGGGGEAMSETGSE